MSELRWHPLLREWVTVAPARQDRTYHPTVDQCPLCPTRPGGPATEIPVSDYHIAVFDNRFPSYQEGQGRSEVVCYTPDHESSLGAQSVAHIADLVEVWQDRFAELGALPEVEYVYIFENRGEEIGVTLSHPHGQVYAYPFVPPRIERELESFAGYRDGTCLYCDLVAAERGGERVVAEAGGWIAFVPEFARWPFEVHVAPVRHRRTLLDLDPEEGETGLAPVLKDLLERYDRLFGKPLAYIMAMHSAPPRGEAPFHLHLEFYPPNRTADKLKFLAGSEAGAGAFIVDVRAEDSARRLRDV